MANLLKNKDAKLWGLRLIAMTARLRLYVFILIFSLLLFYFAAYAAFFFNRPSRTAEITVPTTSATRYITAFPTTGNTKIPPCGAINVQSNAMEIAPAAADPTIQEGST